jgi:hypothetical protein
VGGTYIIPYGLTQRVTGAPRAQGESPGTPEFLSNCLSSANRKCSMNVPSVSKGPDWTEPSSALRGPRHHRIASERGNWCGPLIRDTERQGDCSKQGFGWGLSYLSPKCGALLGIVSTFISAWFWVSNGYIRISVGPGPMKKK